MADMNIEQARHNMIEQQVRPWDVLDAQVLELMTRSPREDFVTQSQRNLAFADIELPIGHGETMMFPRVEGRVLQALAIQPADKILEVGTGSGFLTYMLASMGGSVCSVELNEELAKDAEQRLRDHGINNVYIQVGDASQGWSSRQPYNAIAITGSLPSIPDNFKQQLQIGGRLFVVVGEAPIMEAKLVTRVGTNEWHEETLFETYLSPLKNITRSSKFQF